MQAHGTAGQTYRTPTKQHGWQGTGDHSSSSSDQLNDQVPTVTPYQRCPLIPCMPDLTRGVGSSVTKQQPMSELAGLHAALSSEGVQLLRSPAQQSPAQQLWSQHQQQYQQPQQQQAQSPLRSGLQQHRQHIGSKQQPGQAGIVLSHETPTSAQLGEVGDALSAISSRLQNMQRSKAQQQAPGAPLLSGQATGGSSPAARMPAMDVSGSLDAKFPQQEVLDRLRQELATTNELVHERARRSRSPEKQGMHRQGHSSGSASTSSKASAADQPLQQQVREGSAPSSAWQLQQQELLGLAGGGSKVAADAAAALARQLANSEALRRLQPQQQQQQQRQQPPNQQEVAKQGLQQVQDVTELSQMLLPGVMAQRLAVADCQQKIGALNSALQQHPHLNPAAVQGILESHRKLEQQLEVLRRENQAKELAHMNTLNVLRENTATPRDRRMAQLQHEVLVLQQQLMSKDAQMQRMQGLLAHRSQQQGQQQHSSGELSPVAAEGQRYDEVRQVNRSLWGGLNGAGYPGEGHSSEDGSSSGSGSGSCTDGSSRSRTPSSGSDSGSVGATVGMQLRPRHEQQCNLSPSKVSSLTAHFERQMAAGRTAVPQMQQQLQSLRSPNTQPGILSGAGVRQPGDQHSLPITPSGYQQPCSGHAARTSVDNLKAQVQQQMSALDKQHQQFAGMRASLEASHKRQLETERRQREVTQEKYDMMKAQTEQLVRQLQESRAEAALLRDQRDEAERRSSGGGGSSSGGGAAGDQQEQQRQRLLHESAVRELQGQLAQARQEKADLQAQLKNLAAENETREAEGKKATHRLQMAEKALLSCQDLTEQVQQLKQRNRDLKQQLAQAQEAQDTAEGALQECRRQLAAADSDKAVLMDRIRQLADRASLAESHSQRTRSGDSSGGGSGLSLDVQQQQQAQVQVQSELSVACAELNQQVALLRGQLVDAQSKEERLQVTNAALQERLSRLQAESAARDAGTSSRRSSSTGSQQQQQQQVQELLQQVTNLQEQLAAATTAQAAASAAVAVAGSSNNGSTQQAAEQQQRVDALQQVQQLEAILEDREIELHEWQIHADALEKDLEDLKAQLIAADGLQEQLDATKVQLTAARSQQQQLQQELEQTRGKVSELEFKLHGLNQDRNQLRSQVDALTAELAHAREGAADLRVRLDHFTGPTGPQARVKQLEQALQLAQRKLEAAEKRAAAAASQVNDLTEKLGSTQDQLVALEGHVSILEEQLAEYTQLPQ